MSPSRWPGRSALPWGEPPHSLGPSALPCLPQSCSSSVAVAVGVASGGEAPWHLAGPGCVSAVLLTEPPSANTRPLLWRGVFESQLQED